MNSITIFQRLSLSLILFYLLVSIFPAILFYPVSLLSMFVPVLALFFALCSIRGDYQSTQWPILFIALIGILLKIAAIIVYISLFPLKDYTRKPGRGPRKSINSRSRKTFSFRENRS